MPRAAIRGHKIHFQQVGQGPDIVLIHGLFCNIAFWWFRVAPKLAETHRVTAFDLRGHGFSTMSNEGYRALDMAEDVVALMQHLGIETAHLIGHSFGGAVALAVATLDASKVSKLTLADAWVPSLQAMPPLNDTDAWKKLQSRLALRGISVEGQMPRVAQSFFEEMLDAEEEDGANATAEVGAFAGLQTNTARQQPTLAMRRWRELMQKTPADRQFHDPAGLEPAALGKVTKPIDLVYGNRSRYLQSRDGLAKLMPQARPIEVPNAGHHFPLLRPDAFLGAMGVRTKTLRRPGPARGRLARQMRRP